MWAGSKGAAMTEAIDAARSGMMQHERNIELIANNLANMNTVGYKRLAVHFQDLLSTQQALDVLFGGAPVAPSTGVELDSTTRIFASGTLVPSDDPTSMAIAGNGFFQVLRDGGDTAYTRDGSFGLDAEGYLVSSDGYRLQPPLRLDGPVVEFTVQPTGAVHVRRTAGGETEPLGQLTLALFTDPARLASAGQNLYVATEASGAAQVVAPGEAGAGLIRGGALEASNVDVATEMTNLIAAQRAYQFNLAAFQTADEMLGQLNAATQV